MTREELRSKFIEVVTAQEEESSEQFPEEISFLKGRNFIQIPAHTEIDDICGFFEDGEVTDDLADEWVKFSDDVSDFINECPVLNKFSDPSKGLSPEIREFLVNGNVHIISYNDSWTPSTYYVDEKNIEELKEFIRNF